MKEREYIHGYTEEEQNRLIDQGEILSEFVFDRLDFTRCRRLLDVGCGVGAQTAILLRDYPQLQVTGLEIESKQIQKAEAFLSSLDYAKNRYELIHGNASDEKIPVKNDYDAVLFIWVLEHVTEPMAVLRNVQKFVRQGGKVFAVEVFHSSLQLFPDCPNAMEFWQKSIEYQKSIDGDANIGHRMGNLFYDAGYTDIKISPYPMQFGKYDRERRAKMLDYWHNLMASAVPNMLKAGFTSETLWNKAEQEMMDLKDNDDAVFYYSFVTVEATVPKKN